MVLTMAIHQKQLLNAYKGKKNRLFALILEYVRCTKIPIEYEKTSDTHYDVGGRLIPRI